MTDFAAYVCHLRALESMDIRSHMGRAMQRLCLQVVGQSNPQLAEELHEHGHQTKAYATSGLLQWRSTQPILGAVKEGDRAWIRLVGLNADVVYALDNFMNKVNQGTRPVVIKLDSRQRPNWEVERVTNEDQWGGRSMAQSLMDVQPSRKATFAFHFASPTGFRRDGLTLPLPLPELVYGSLERQWRDLTGIQTRLIINDFLKYMLVLERHDIQTHALRFKKGTVQVGFVGDVHMSAMRRNAKLEKKEPELHAELQRFYDPCMQFLAAVSRFAFYSGVGIKTTQGMGMTRVQIS